MSLKKSLLVGTLAVLLGIAPTMQVSAAETTWFNVEGLEDEGVSFVEDTQYVLTKGNHLSSGNIQLSNLGSRVLAISGTTNCHMTCDRVTCNMYLEQMDSNGNWYTYKYWLCSTTNTYAYSPERTTSVDGGHWYRARGAHIAIKNGVSESVSTITNGIWVD